MRNIPICFLIFVVGCVKPPIQGYDGPERPANEIAIVQGVQSSTDTKIVALGVDGRSFLDRDVALLPGEYRFQLVGGFGTRPHSCVDADRMDHSGYNTCLENRNRQIREKSPYVDECDYDSYVEQKQLCLREYTDYRCELRMVLEPGTRYQLGLYEFDSAAQFYCDIDAGEDNGVPRQQVAKGRCEKVGTRSAHEEFSGHFYD